MANKVEKETNNMKTITLAKVYVPKDPLNEFENYVTVYINNREFNILRGTSVDVSINVAEELKRCEIISDFVVFEKQVPMQK